MAENKPLEPDPDNTGGGKNMKKKVLNACALSKMLCTIVALCATSQLTFGQTRDSVQLQRLQKVIVSDSRVSNKVPLTTSTVDKEELHDAGASVSMPFLLETQPSVVASGENGTVGATALRIRGVDASRINVNINGITLNDPESQAVYWYNIPNLGGMAQSLQIQRGVGASTGGSPAFGAAINLQTLNANNKPYGELSLGNGSWNTREMSLGAGTGIMKSGLSFDFAYTGLTSDGFVRSYGTDQHSFFGSASWYGKRTLIKLLTIIGSQTTGITWDGAYKEQLDIDPTYNPSGEYVADDGSIQYYRNETDNYWQRHYQLYVSHMFSDRWNINGAIDFTHGDGYYEQYKAGASYKKKLFLPNSGSGDFTTRKQMDNNAIAGNLALRYKGDKLSLSLGDNVLYFDGDHFGNVLWFRDTAIHVTTPYEWYRYNGNKVDNSVYLKGTYDFNENLNIYADLQLRIVNYTLTGSTDDRDTSKNQCMVDFHETYIFPNPKVGLNYRINDHQRTYFVAGLSHREPTKSDIKEAIANGETVKPESMLDIEWGYQLAHSNWAFKANLYAMLYKDQLTPNGDLSSSGYKLMENVDKSYRMGIELEGGYRFSELFRLDANLTLSQNKVIDNVFTDFNDGDAVTQTVTKTTDLALSPNIIGAAIATFTPVKNGKIQLVGKYVGKQYADNTSRDCYAIDSYFLLNAKISYTWQLKGSQEFEAQLLVNNMLNHNYRLCAWVEDWAEGWDAVNDTENDYRHHMAYLQQPGCNFMARLIYRF